MAKQNIHVGVILIEIAKMQGRNNSLFGTGSEEVVTMFEMTQRPENPGGIRRKEKKQLKWESSADDHTWLEASQL